MTVGNLIIGCSESVKCNVLGACCGNVAATPTATAAIKDKAKADIYMCLPAGSTTTTQLTVPKQAGLPTGLLYPIKECAVCVSCGGKKLTQYPVPVHPAL